MSQEQIRNKFMSEMWNVVFLFYGTKVVEITSYHNYWKMWFLWHLHVINMCIQPWLVV